MSDEKNYSITVNMPSEEEFDELFKDMTDEEMEAHMEDLSLAENVGEFIELLKGLGINVEEEEISEDEPGFDDTIH